MPIGGNASLGMRAASGDFGRMSDLGWVRIRVTMPALIPDPVFRPVPPTSNSSYSQTNRILVQSNHAKPAYH